MAEVISLTEALRDPKLARLLIEEWQLAFEALDARPLPMLVRTDGEALPLTIDRFTLAEHDRAAVLERLSNSIRHPARGARDRASMY